MKNEHIPNTGLRPGYVIKAHRFVCCLKKFMWISKAKCSYLLAFFSSKDTGSVAILLVS